MNLNPYISYFHGKAFAAVSLGNGKFALGFNEVVDRNRFSSISTYFIQMSLAVPQSNPGLTSQEVTIVTNNNVLASDTAVFQQEDIYRYFEYENNIVMTLLSRYDLGDTTTSTEETSSTSTETAVTEDQV